MQKDIDGSTNRKLDLSPFVPKVNQFIFAPRCTVDKQNDNNSSLHSKDMAATNDGSCIFNTTGTSVISMFHILP